MLHLAVPQRYTLQVNDGGSYRLSSGGLQCKFTPPASTRGIAKLYTPSLNRKLIYVGIAGQPMSSRLNFGFKATGRGGYHGYKWRTLRESLTLHVWTVQGTERNASLRELETVEAEVAFFCRQISGQWPAYQHEIHFYPSSGRHRIAAMKIYEIATNDA